MLVVAFMFAVGLILLLRWRGKRKRTLAGLEATRPVYGVAPPVARLSNLKGERL